MQSINQLQAVLLS